MKPKIEDLKIDVELLQAELRVKPDKNRNSIMRKYAGGCCIGCYDIPTKKISYDVGGAQLVEFYCDKCFNYRKEGRRKEDLDKLN